MLKFRRTKISTRKQQQVDDDGDSTKFDSGRMKKAAPLPPSVGAKPPPSTTSIPRQVSVIAHNPDDSAINELLEGRMELDVVLPGDKTVKMTVERRMPMMDLLVQVTSANKVTPGGHMIHVVTERGNDIIHYKPSTPIGSLDANTIHVVPKNSVIVPPVKKLPKVVNQPFEQTFRLQVNLPRNQLSVLRVSPKTTLADVLQITCQDKGLESANYDLRHPNHLDESLNANTRLSEYGLNEITLLSLRSVGMHSSTGDMLFLRAKDEEKKKKGLFGFQWKRKSKTGIDCQSDDPNSRGVSPTRSDSSSGGYGYTSSDGRSASPNRPISFHEGMSVNTCRPTVPARTHAKKRPAPPPPPRPSTSQQDVVLTQQQQEQIVVEKEKPALVSHSRHSSDSSGYHEASVLSDALDSIPTAQSSSPTTSNETDSSIELHRRASLSPSASLDNRQKDAEPPDMQPLTSSVSCSNVSVSSTAFKKRRAPPPPPPSDNTETDVHLGLQKIAVEEIEKIEGNDDALIGNPVGKDVPEEFCPEYSSGDHLESETVDSHERRPSLTSLGTINDIEACFGQTIAEAERIINAQEHDYEKCGISDEKLEDSGETVVDDRSYDSAADLPNEECRSDGIEVKSSEDVFFSAAEELSSSVQHETQRDEETNDGPYPYAKRKNRPSLKEIYPSLSVKSDGDDNLTEKSSASSECSVESQIRVPFTQAAVEETIPVSEAGHPTEVAACPLEGRKLDSSGGRIDPPSVVCGADAENTNKGLSSRFLSMQDLCNASDADDSKVVQEDVESTMRKVNSEVNLLLAKNKESPNADRDPEELQKQYLKLQEQFVSWQRQLAENQAVLQTKNVDDVTLSIQKENICVSTSEKAASLPRIARRSDESKQVTVRRHKPSIKIGSWADQNPDVHIEYKTEIAIRSDELESVTPGNQSAVTPNFRISHSKLEPGDIYGGGCPKTNARVVSSEPKAPWRRNHAEVEDGIDAESRRAKTFTKNQSYNKWPGGNSRTLPVFKTRGVTTNNRGELVITDSRVDDSWTETQKAAIHEAKNMVIEQVKNEVKVMLSEEGSGDGANGIPNANRRPEKVIKISKGTLLEPNSGGKYKPAKYSQGRSPVVKTFRNIEPSTNRIVTNCNVYIKNSKKLAPDGEKENVNSNGLPPPPPPPPVPNVNKNNNVASNGSAVLVSGVAKKKPRKVIEPKLDPREELMLAIRDCGGRCALKKV